MEIILNQFPHAEIFLAIYIGHFQVDPNDPNYDSDSTEPKGPLANGTKRTIKLNTMVNKFQLVNITTFPHPLLSICETVIIMVLEA